MSSVQKFEGFEAALPSGATVRESTKADPDGPRRTHRVDIDVGNERITVFATWRRGWVAVHLDWLALLEERLATPVQAIEGLERFPLERRGQLDRTVYVRQGMKPLGKYNACNADWVHDILIELDDQGQPSEAAAAVLDSFAPTPEVKVPIPPEALPSNEHLPRAVGLDAGGVVEFVAFLPVHRHVDLKDASETSDRDPGFADEPVGLWGWPSHWRFFAVGFGPTTFRLRWAISREEAMADAADWDHVVEAALALSTNRLAVIADTDQPDGQIEITLPASGQVGMVYRFRGEFDRVGSPEPQGEYEIVCYQPPSVWEPLVIVDSGLFRA